MISRATPMTGDLITEYSVTVADVDYLLKVKRYAEDSGYNAGQTWVQLEYETFQPGRLPVYISQMVDPSPRDLDCIREAFNGVRGKMRHHLRNWQDFKTWAPNESRGKRAYYSKLGNQSLKRALEVACEWSLVKAVWKEMTKLRYS